MYVYHNIHKKPEMSEENPIIKIQYLNFYQLPKTKDTDEFEYRYNMVESDSENTIYDVSNEKLYILKVNITGPRLAAWMANGYSGEQLEKICFEYGRRHLIEKIKEGSVQAVETLNITTDSFSERCDFDPNKLPEIIGQIDRITSYNNPLK